MAELHNPLFENEKEFLERQKLEYERALMGDVEDIKAKTRQVSKVALVGLGVASGVWLLTKVFGSSSKSPAKKLGSSSKNRKKKKRLSASTPRGVGAMTDDLGFGSAPLSATHSHGRPAQLAPDVYHTDAADADPFPPLPPRPASASYARAAYQEPEPEEESGFTAILADGVQAFLKSDTGKMLMAQATAVVMAYAAKKVGDYLPLVKNPDLATSPEPETRDINFTYHDDAHAPRPTL